MKDGTPAVSVCSRHRHKLSIFSPVAKTAFYLYIGRMSNGYTTSRLYNTFAAKMREA